METFSLWPSANNNPLGTTIDALRTIRSSVIRDEKTELHQAIAEALRAYDISYRHEYQLGPRCRIDFLASDGIGIEAKKGKQNSKVLLRQLEQYAAFDMITGLILVIETSIDLPHTVCNKPLKVVSLYKQWGIAL